METEIIQVAMTEQLKELQNLTEKVEALTSQIIGLTEKIATLANRPAPQPPVIPKPDLTKVEVLLNGNLDKVGELIQTLDRPVIKQWRFPLFPEYNADRYYKIVFGRCIPLLLLFVVFTYLYFLGRSHIESSRQVEYRRYNYQKYESVLKRLDSTLNQVGRKKLHDAMQQAEPED